MHPRRAIIEAIKASLKSISQMHFVQNTRVPLSTTAGTKFPGITFYADNEPIETLTILLQPRPQLRHLTLVVTVWVGGTRNLEDFETELDLQSSRIEAVMSNTIDNVDDLRLIATDFSITEDEPYVHSVTLTYQVDYSTTEFLT